MITKNRASPDVRGNGVERRVMWKWLTRDKTYNEIMHNVKNGGIGIEAWMYRIFDMRIGSFLEKQLRKLFKEDT